MDIKSASMTDHITLNDMIVMMRGENPAWLVFVEYMNALNIDDERVHVLANYVGTRDLSDGINAIEEDFKNNPVFKRDHNITAYHRYNVEDSNIRVLVFSRKRGEYISVVTQHGPIFLDITKHGLLKFSGYLGNDDYIKQSLDLGLIRIGEHFWDTKWEMYSEYYLPLPNFNLASIIEKWV